jgi:hypothetical protein
LEERVKSFIFIFMNLLQISLFYSYYYVKVKGPNLLEGLKRDYVVSLVRNTRG